VTASPDAPPPDDKDWTWVLERPCPECGFDAAAIRHEQLPALIRHSAAQFETALSDPLASQRRAELVWSPLEYACHVRDACRIFDTRLRLMLDEHDPSFPNWDQDATALEQRYWAQDPATVAAELAQAAAGVADDFAAVCDDQWGRSGRRSNGSMFTVDTLGRYFVHDLIHHTRDIGG
jgi:DinB superfamily